MAISIDQTKAKLFEKYGLGSAADYTGAENQVSDLNKVMTQSLPDTSIINSTNTQPTSEIPFVSPQEVPVYDVSNLAIPQLETTQPEKSAQTLTEQLEALNTQLVGEGAYRGQMEQEQGIPEAIKTKNDLTNQLNLLSTEAQQIPLTIQNQFQGRGATAQGVAPIQTAQLRENAIKALGVSALLNAANNNLTTSQTLVDRLVAQKYSPIKEEIDAKTKNLNLIIQSPDYTTAEKNRALQQQAILDAQKTSIAQQEQNSKDIWSVATQAATNITSFVATQKYPSSAVALQAISNAQTPQEALQIASETGLLTQLEELTYKELPDGRAVMIDAQGNIKKVISSAVGSGSGDGSGDQLYSGLSSATAMAVRSKVAKFSTEPLIQNFATIQDGYNFSTAISDTTTNPADDQALIYSLAKALDPNSVVREGEYATAQKYAQSWVKAYGKGVSQAVLGTGFLSEEARKNIKKTIQQKYEASKKSYDNLNKQYEEGINSLTGRNDADLFLIDYTTPKVEQNNVVDNQNNQTTVAPVEESPWWKKVGDFLWGTD